MKILNQEQVNEIVSEHKLWLRGRRDAKCADLSYARLAYIDLSGVNLSHANLKGVSLRHANLSYSDFVEANLEDADLSRADLRCSDFEYANLSGANLVDSNLKFANLSHTNLDSASLMRADLTNADLTRANLRNANLRDTILRGASLIGANLEDVITNMCTVGYNLACPEEGSFIGYKKASGLIIKLLIPDDAKRCSATTMKCRCNKAIVLEIEDIYTGKKVDYVRSDYDKDFVYTAGETVYVDNFDEDRWHECSNGIHFFMNKANAIKY